MTHRISFIASLVTVALVMGCDNGGIVSADLTGEPQSKEALTTEEPEILQQEGIAAGKRVKEGKRVKYVPFKGTFILTPLTGTDEADLADMGVECEPEVLEIFDRWNGVATHIGTFTGLSNGCFDTVASVVTGVVGHFNAANGDQLRLEASGVTDPPGIPFGPGVTVVWDFEITGGTGRFSNASTPPGEPIVGVSTFNPPDPFTFEARGRLSSVGSSK